MTSLHSIPRQSYFECKRSKLILWFFISLKTDNKVMSSLEHETINFPNYCIVDSVEYNLRWEIINILRIKGFILFLGKILYILHKKLTCLSVHPSVCPHVSKMSLPPVVYLVTLFIHIYV